MGSPHAFRGEWRGARCCDACAACRLLAAAKAALSSAGIIASSTRCSCTVRSCSCRRAREWSMKSESTPATLSDDACSEQSESRLARARCCRSSSRCQDHSFVPPPSASHASGCGARVVCVLRGGSGSSGASSATYSCIRATTSGSCSALGSELKARADCSSRHSSRKRHSVSNLAPTAGSSSISWCWSC